MTDLPALLRRIQGATGRDDVLDVSLYAHFWEGFPIAEEIASRRIIPAFTGSIDAALGLVARVLPGWQLHMLHGGVTRWHTTLCVTDNAMIDAEGEAKTAALSILTALLLAQSTPAQADNR